MMGRTWILYKDRKYMLDYLEIKTLIIEGQEQRVVSSSYRSQVVNGANISEIRSQLEQIFDEELKLEDTVDEL